MSPCRSSPAASVYLLFIQEMFKRKVPFRLRIALLGEWHRTYAAKEASSVIDYTGVVTLRARQHGGSRVYDVCSCVLTQSVMYDTEGYARKGRWRSWLSHLSNTQKVLSSNLGRLIVFGLLRRLLIYTQTHCAQPTLK